MRALNLLRGPHDRLPRLTTPEREAYERYRERQAKRTESARGPMRGAEDLSSAGADDRPPPLGSDPVEGDPVDLRALYSEDAVEPTAEQIAQANADAEKLYGEGPAGFGDDIDKLLGN